MTVKYKVIWSDIAENDLINIIEYIAEHNLANAKKIFYEIKESADKLYYLPERGRVVPELLDQGISIYREIIIKVWRIVYRISEKKVYILLVFDSRRNAEDILLNRLIRI